VATTLAGSTGRLAIAGGRAGPGDVRRADRISPVQAWLAGLHARHAANDNGSVASYIPELATADPNWFGIALATVDGSIHAFGDADVPFTIQSISKPLTYGLALERLGEPTVRSRIGVEPTGDAFNAITLDPTTGRPLNPMVNAGAIAAAGLLLDRHPSSGRRAANAFSGLLAAYGRFAGRRLVVDERVLASERSTGHRNRAIAQLLRSTGAIDGDPDDVVDLYFRQCSVAVTAGDLASIAATLANGGRNPRTGEQVLSAGTTRSVLSVMATCGMYDGAGEWMFAVGLPAKSGVAGGLIAVLPGRLGVGIFSPALDDHGNSVRAVAVCRDLSTELDLHLVTGRGAEASPIRAQYCLADVGSKRRRGPPERAALAAHGDRSVVVELQGSLAILSVERIASNLIAIDPTPSNVILDLRRVTAVEPSSRPLLAHLVADLRAVGAEVLLSAPQHLTAEREAIRNSLAAIGEAGIATFSELDLAIEHVEEQLLASADPCSPPAGSTGAAPVALGEHALLDGLSRTQLTRVGRALIARSAAAGERIVAIGEPATELFLVTSGRLSVSIETATGDRRRLATLGPGMMFGEGALLGAGRRSADVDCDDAVVCHALPVDAFDDLVRADPMIGTVMLRNLARIIGDTAQRLTRELAILAG
jgi:glutaminase